MKMKNCNNCNIDTDDLLNPSFNLLKYDNKKTREEFKKIGEKYLFNPILYNKLYNYILYMIKKDIKEKKTNIYITNSKGEQKRIKIKIFPLLEIIEEKIN